MVCRMPNIQSHADIRLTLATIATIIGTILTPILLHNITAFNFEILPLNYYLFIILLIILYSILAEIVKKVYIKKTGKWL